MTRLLQVMGVLLIVMGMRSLFHSDWFTFLMFSALGVSFLIDAHSSKSLRGLRKILILVVFVLAILRLMTLL